MAGGSGIAVTSADISSAVPSNIGNGAVGQATTQLAPANSNRKGCRIQNQSTLNVLYLRFGAAATADFNAIQIMPGATYQTSVHVPLSSINVIANGNNTPVNAAEWG